MDYIDIIEKSIYNIDSKICGIIDDYRVLQEPQKVADYVIQFLRTYLEHIAARIYAFLRNCDGLNVSDKSFKVLKFDNNRITLEEEL